MVLQGFAERILQIPISAGPNKLESGKGVYTDRSIYKIAQNYSSHNNRPS